MKVLVFGFLAFGLLNAAAQVGPPNNVGREYGNPKMPLMISHLAGANKERLKRATSNSRHSIFGKILCFRKLCRIQSGHSASLKAISFKKFRKKIARNAKKGLYKKTQVDTAYRQKPVKPIARPVAIDTTVITTLPVVKADTLIILGAEVLFEVNKATLRSEHFGTLNPIVDYLIAHSSRAVIISGHTDNTGSEAHNLSLSKKRADVVAEYLVSNGVAISRVTTEGLGSSKPIAANTSNEGRKKNRRVELLIHDDK